MGWSLCCQVISAHNSFRSFPVICASFSYFFFLLLFQPVYISLHIAFSIFSPTLCVALCELSVLLCKFTFQFFNLFIFYVPPFLEFLIKIKCGQRMSLGAACMSTDVAPFRKTKVILHKCNTLQEMLVVLKKYVD